MKGTFNKNESEISKFKLKSARKIDKEQFYGMVEYKLLLNDILIPDKYEQLKSQMLFRLHQGEGKAVYNIGWFDDGIPHGIEYDTLLKSLSIIHNISNELTAIIQSIKIRKGTETGRYCAIVFMTNDKLCHDLLPPHFDHLF